MALVEWLPIHSLILELEREGLLTRTFRRLDPARQEAVLSAILDEAIEKGPASLNIKKVAEKADVAVGSLYQYFGNREGLLNFAVAVSVRILNDLMKSVPDHLAGMPLREALRGYLAGGVDLSKMQNGLMQFFARAAYHSDSVLADEVVRPVATTMREVVLKLLEQARARGEIRADLDLEAVARVVHALSIAYGDSLIFPYLNTYFQIHNADVPSERTLDALLDLIMLGIGTRGEITHRS